MANISEKLTNELISVGEAMFRKDFLGIFHGAISARLNNAKFIINKKDAIFDSLAPQDFTTISHKQDYSWQEASTDAFIHSRLYSEIEEARYAACSFCPFSVAYSLRHDAIAPKDYFGHKNIGTVAIYDPKDFESWYERADVEICNAIRLSKHGFVVIRGYGIYIVERDIYNLAKTISIIENSAKILLLGESGLQNLANLGGEIAANLAANGGFGGAFNAANPANLVNPANLAGGGAALNAAANPQNPKNQAAAKLEAEMENLERVNLGGKNAKKSQGKDAGGAGTAGAKNAAKDAKNSKDS